MNITAHSTHNTTICLCHKQLWFPNYQHLPYCQTIFSHLLSKLSDYHHCVTFQANSRVNKVTDWPLEMNCGVFSIFDQVRTKTNSGRGRVQVCQIMAPSQSLTWRKIQSISWNFWSSREMMWTKWKISFLSQCFMAFLWISKRGLSFQSTESFGQDNNSFCCQFLLRVAIALWVETHTLNRYLPGTRRGCIKMNLSPFGPPSLPPKGPCQGLTKGRRRIRSRLQKLISHIHLSLQSYTICYTTEKFRIVSMARALACCEIYNNSCHILVSATTKH